MTIKENKERESVFIIFYKNKKNIYPYRRFLG